MTGPRRLITRSDILPMSEYGGIRREQRQRMAEIKRMRRIEVGPYSTFYFENFETMWHQIHEMLFVEKGGEDQIQGELDAYNPLIPNGDELVATVMFEIEEPRRRTAALYAIGGIEHRILMTVSGETIRGRSDDTRENTSEDGKASSVQFVRFPLSERQKRIFADGDDPVMLGFDHPNYGHLAVMPAAIRRALASDLSL